MTERLESRIRHGGKILADQLAIQQCEAVFSVAGESFLPALDGLYDHPSIRTVTCRHEGGAAIMAEAYGKMTQRPAVCFVTRGPGATNASLGVHIAKQDSTPMVLMIGQVERQFLDREGFQEVDFCAMFRPLAKWVAQVEDVKRIPEYVSRAWRIAMSGRPGPVVLAFPEDVLYDEAQVADLPPVVLPQCAVPPQTAAMVADFFAGAKRPLIVVGGSGWSEQLRLELAEFSIRNHLPVVAEFRCQDYIDNTHPNYIGDLGISTGPQLANIMRDSDRILCIGARLGELPTRKYSLIEAPLPKAKFFHVHPELTELGSVYQPDVAINADSKTFIASLDNLQLDDTESWIEWTQKGRAAYVQHSTLVGDDDDTFTNEKVIDWLQAQLPPDTIVVSGSGINTGVLHRYHRYGATFRTQLAPIAGSMGYGVPAAISAKLCAPQRKVICICGDGCFMMTAQELATAAMLNLEILMIVINNSMLGTIRKHQENHFPKRVIATDLVNPDFAKFSQSFGGLGLIARSITEFADAYKAADSYQGISLIDVQVDQEQYINSLMA